jgi:hypothetical protein
VNDIGEPYLILHKVRGEPAFDIATCIGEDGDGEIWIIPTSGHRAYPFWCGLLTDMVPGNLYPTPEIPVSWPDHYTISERAEYGHHEVRKSAVNDLLRAIGRAKPSLIRRTVR